MHRFLLSLLAVLCIVFPQAAPAAEQDPVQFIPYEEAAQKLVAGVRAKGKVTLFDREGKTVEKK